MADSPSSSGRRVEVLTVERVPGQPARGFRHFAVCEPCEYRSKAQATRATANGLLTNHRTSVRHRKAIAR